MPRRKLYSKPQKKTVSLVSSTLYCLICSKAGLATANKITSALINTPLRYQRGKLDECLRFAPQSLWLRVGAPADITPLPSLPEFVGNHWDEPGASYLFVGATGIAVRIIAPFIKHKSYDPPILVVDSAGKFVISLLCGHLGHANTLANHLANLIGATSVVTTASDHAGVESLDMICKSTGLRILNWKELAQIQGRILEKEKIPLWDPYRRLRMLTNLNCVKEPPVKGPAILIHWKKQTHLSGFLRLTWPALHVGVGFRKGVEAYSLENAIYWALDLLDAERESLASLATAKEKANELEAVAIKMNTALQIFDSSRLAQIDSPTPSLACGKRFGTKPFSVCEASALLAAGDGSVLLTPKIIYNREVTVAIALDLKGKG